MAGKSHLFMTFRPKSLANKNDNTTESVQADLSNRSAQIPDISELVQPNYNKLSEGLRKKTPTSVICLAFCGGRKCRFDTSDRWSSDDMAIDGLYSHWVTDEVLAAARPNAQLIDEKDVVGQFVRSGIKTIINLQIPGEHSHCGPPLTKSGFSYLPELFMEKGIYHYNFGWKDYEHGSLGGLLDAVKVLTFAVTQGKVVVHCHAGLGRTGVLLCCYLIYTQRLQTVEAIRYVRRKRPNAVQTSGQITMVQRFEQHLFNSSNIFYVSKIGGIESGLQPFTLRQHLEHQKDILHGYEARVFRYIPKIIYVICERLLVLCRAGPSPTLNYQLDENRPPFTRSFFSFTREKDSRRQPYRDIGLQSDEALSMMDEQFGQVPSFDQINYSPALSNDDTQVLVEKVVGSLVMKSASDLSNLPATVSNYCLELDGRQSGWMILSSEKEPQVLSALLWHWLLHLKQPVLTNQELGLIVVYADQPLACFYRFDQPTRYTVEYLLRFIQRLCRASEICNVHSTDLLRQLASVLTQRSVDIHGVDSLTDGHKKLGQGTLTKLLRFLTLSLVKFNEASND